MPATVPHAAAAALVGRGLGDLLDHPILRGDGWTITGAANTPIGLAVRFRCPPTPVVPGLPPPEPGLEWQQLGRDGRLAGEEAARDLVLRARQRFVGNRLSVPVLAEAIAERLAWRLPQINLMAPPWGRTMATPSQEEVADILAADDGAGRREG